MSSQFSHRRKTRGFTLVEMVITMAIFILLSAAVFGIISCVLQTASTLQENQNRRDQLEALNAYLNNQLRAMPAGSVLISYRRGDGEGLVQNGIIWGQDKLLTALDAKLQSNGLYTLQLTAFDPRMLPKFSPSPLLFFESLITQNDPGIIWTPLIHDIRSIGWKFQILNMTDWLDVWSDPGNKANLVEFTIEQAGDLQPSVIDFWLPHIEPINLASLPGLTNAPATNAPATNAPATNAP
jgi:prepilin-type N-terminal cleavage/methylation domain-containing protein